MNELSESIKTLAQVSDALQGFSNREENYNSSYAIYLDQLAAEMYKMSNELKEINYMFGGF